ncbi:MAG: calcium/sodium antiporter [Clostridia bacterium]|nr:calcium/sodium antiporter [Clostridia bacterium]
MIISIFFIVIGFVFLVKGADFLVDGASNIAKKFKISEMVIGLTIVAIGTSLPELVITIKGTLDGYSDLSIGSNVGSCILNLLVVLGVSSFINPIKMNKKTKISNLIFTFLSIISVWVFGNIGLEINRAEGIMLLLIFVVFLMNLDYKNNQESEKNNDRIRVVPSILLIIIGIIGLKYGGDFIIDNSIKLANKFGVAESVLGLTIMSIGSSLPELITGIVSARRGESDLLIGNIIGSNIFNLLLVIGLSASIHPIAFSDIYNLYFLFLFICTLSLVLFDFIGKKNEITKRDGVILLVLFLFYVGRVMYI